MSKLDNYIDMLESYLDLNIDDFLGLNRFAIKNILDLLKENEKLKLELDSANSNLKKYANKLIKIYHLHDHYVEYDYREFDKLLEEVLYNE